MPSNDIKHKNDDLLLKNVTKMFHSCITETLLNSKLDKIRCTKELYYPMQFIKWTLETPCKFLNKRANPVAVSSTFFSLSSTQQPGAQVFPANRLD